MTMQFNLKQNLLTLAMLSCVAGMIGCSSTAKSSTNTEPNKAVVSSEKSNGEKTDKHPTSPTNRDTPIIETTASTGDKIGVAECDDYIEKYEACIRANVPESARQTLKNSFDQTRQTWKGLAANPQTKASLASVCKQSKDMAKQSMGAYYCEW